MVDVGSVVSSALPSVLAMVRAYGAAVFDRLRDRVPDAAADETVKLGQQVLERLMDSRHAPQLAAAVEDVVDHPDDEDFQAGLKGQMKKALADDTALSVDIERLMQVAGVTIVAMGARSVAAQTISGIVMTGDNSHVDR